VFFLPIHHSYFILFILGRVKFLRTAVSHVSELNLTLRCNLALHSERQCCILLLHIF
jgi:hypothetical protein